MINHHFISSTDLGTGFHIFSDYDFSSGQITASFLSNHHDDWFLVMENGVLKAGPPNNGNHVFEVLDISAIRINVRHGGCFITFNDNGDQKSGCSISEHDAKRDQATHITATIK